MMDTTGMDSDHSSHASSGSPAVAVKPPSSPVNNNNNPTSNNHNQVHSPRQASPLGPPMSMGHPLSPPPVSNAGLVRSMGLGHLHPPGLGLLNSLGVLHSPLDLMAHHAPPRSYNSPPPISTSDPTANECKLVDYRGQKVAAFIIAGDTMLCLPQAFELFLKHLVGGLHTVYTKLKRLDIVPLVCNVEQVRILRGLGAIQPGVNRCKLLSCKDFDTLYKDCTTARMEPRLVWRWCRRFVQCCKGHLQGCVDRVAVATVFKRQRRDHHQLAALKMSLATVDETLAPTPHQTRFQPGNQAHVVKEGYHLCPLTPLTTPTASNATNSPELHQIADYQVRVALLTRLHRAALSFNNSITKPIQLNPIGSRPGRPPKRAPVGLSLAASHLQHQQLKKQRLDNGDYPYENGHMGDISRMEKSPLLANGYNHPPHLGHMQFMQLPHPAAAHSALLSPAMPHNLARPDGSVIKNQGMPSMEAIARSGIWENCRAAYEDIVKHLERLREERGDPDRPIPLDQKVRDLSPRNGSPTDDHSPVLNLSKSGGGSAGSLGDGDHSGSEADGPDAPPSPRSPRSAAEDEEEENISEADDEDEKDQDLDEGDLPLPAAPGSDSQQAAINYSTLASAVASANGPSQDPSVSSTETLLRNIQGLLKVAADNARQQERQINYEKAELKMDVLREREVKDNLERQLIDEQKLRALVQKRLRRERRARRRLQEQLELEVKRRVQLEDALKTAGGAEQIRIINENVSINERQCNQKNNNSSPLTAQSLSTERIERPDRPERERIDSPPGSYSQSVREQPPSDTKPWGYSGIDLINTGAAFWQNYSESLAQELEMERKSRQQQVEAEVKSPLQDRQNYYKNSVLFTSSAT